MRSTSIASLETRSSVGNAPIALHNRQPRISHPQVHARITGPCLTRWVGRGSGGGHLPELWSVCRWSVSALTVALGDGGELRAGGSCLFLLTSEEPC